MDLIEQLIQLGEKKTHLQPHLKAILDDLLEKEKSKSWYDQDTTIKTPQQDVPKSKSDPEGEVFFVSPHARKAFEEVLLPEIEAKIDSYSSDEIYKMMSEMETLGTNKNFELENMLIVHKPISMDTPRFYAEIQEAFKDWVVPRLKGQNAPNSGGEAKEYNFNFQ